MTAPEDPQTPADAAPPDLDLARRFIAAHPPPGALLACAVTGSHIYGFSSPDSDIDLKGIHRAPTRALLGFGKPQETHDRLSVFDGVECDLTTHEVGKALGLLLAGNGNMLERFESPIQVCDTPEAEALRALSRGARSKRFVRHYAGFFRGICREHLRAPEPTAKALLYAYRVALTGTHLLMTGALVCDVRVLAPEYGLPEVLDLVAYKASHAEKAIVPPDMDALHRHRWARLSDMLDDARAHSPLPHEPANVAECEAWLVDLRLKALRDEDGA